MPSPSLLSIFPNPDDLLALEPEELSGVLIEVIPGVLQGNGTFSVQHLVSPLYPLVPPSYPPGRRMDVTWAIAEAVQWLFSQGLVVADPTQPVGYYWFRPTRRAQKLVTRADVEAYRKGRILPVELLQPTLGEKVWPLFLRGDHDVAVFQAFKEVEVFVRKAANAKGAGYPDDLIGVTLMRRAFHPESGPLMDATRVMRNERLIWPCSLVRLGTQRTRPAIATLIFPHKKPRG